jgi:hypothetical protein
VVDGAPSKGALVSLDAGVTWASYVGVLYKSALHAFASTDNVPTALKTVSMDIAVTAGIDKAANLPVTDKEPLDGSMTIEIVYL